MSLSLRPARVNDSVIAAALLAETTGEFGVEVLGLGRAELQFRALQRWFEEKGNRFSFEFSTIAERYGMVSGLLLAFPGGRLDKLTLGCGKRTFDIYSFSGGLRMMWLNKTLASFREAEKDEYLIAHLAVDERSRWLGIGKALLEKAAQDASEQNFKKLVLDVEIGNDKAIALYRKAGFEKVDTILFNKKHVRMYSPGMYKMLKNL